MNIISRTNIKIKLFSKFYTRYKIAKSIDEFIHTMPSDKNITLLEVGAKRKNYFKLLNNVQRLTLDIDSKNSPDIVADICDLSSIDSNSYDYVVMLEVLEHVHSPDLALKEINRVLKKKGVLFLTTPFLFPAHDEPYDFYRYTKYGLKLLCKKFDSVKITPFDYFFVSVWTLFSRLTMVKSKKQQLVGFVFYIVALPFLPVAILLDFFTKFEQFSSRYTVIAKKKEKNDK